MRFQPKIVVWGEVFGLMLEAIFATGEVTFFGRSKWWWIVVAPLVLSLVVAGGLLIGSGQWLFGLILLFLAFILFIMRRLADEGWDEDWTGASNESDKSD